MPKQEIKKHFKALESMTDEIGVLQHESDPKYGYSIDDQTRALIAYSRYSKQFQNIEKAETFLIFIITSKRTDKHFNNYKNSKNKWVTKWKGQKQTKDHLQDCDGRVIWALSEFSFSDYPKSLTKKSKSLLFDSLDIAHELTFPHSLAFTVIGLSKYLKNESNKIVKKINSELTEKLVYLSKKEDWKTYCIARIPQALLLAGELEIGKKYLEDIIKQSFDEQERFCPAKNIWGDEQPIEAAAASEAFAEAYKITSKRIYLQTAKIAMEWFEGKNSQSLDLLAENRAVYDAITSEGDLNLNQGAESLVGYLMARGAMENIGS